MKNCRKPASAGHVPECKLYPSFIRNCMAANPARGGRKPPGKGKASKGRGCGFGKFTKGGRGGYKKAYNVYEDYAYPQTYDAASAPTDMPSRARRTMPKSRTPHASRWQRDTGKFSRTTTSILLLAAAATFSR